MAVPEEPRLPDDATFPQPVTDAERAGVEAFLTWGHLEVDWARRLAKRAARTLDTVCR